MKILEGSLVSNFEQATLLAFEAAGVDDMSTEVADLFVSALDTNRFRNEADKNIRSAVRERFGGKATWEKKYWLTPVPELQFKTKPIPQLIILVQPYLASPAEVETPDDFYSITLVGTIGKPEVLTIPITLLHAILHNDLGRFRILARSGNRTTMEIPGAIPVELPNEFLTKFCQTLERKSVADWLGDFGTQGQSIVPLVVGALIGLRFMDVTQPIPSGQQAWSKELIIAALEEMAYTTKEANQMFNRAAPNLRAEHTFEEAMRIVLQQAGKGEG